ECTRIAFNEATLLAKYIHIDNYEKFSVFVHIERMIDIEDEDKEVEDNKSNESINLPNNEISSLSHSISVGNAALEIARILSDSQNKND
ncbi:9785_t:CDS:2, partial [Funneliformis geosporum]